MKFPADTGDGAVPDQSELLRDAGVRARNDKGHYIKDDPSTPENEAWTTKVKKAVTGKKKK